MKSPELYLEDKQSTHGLRRLKWLWLWYTYLLVSWAYYVTHYRSKPYTIFRFGGWWNGGRATDGDPNLCPECGHVFRVRQAIHGYASVGEDDVEPMDYCPRCGAEV